MMIRYLFLMIAGFSATVMAAEENDLQAMARDQFAFAARQYQGLLQQMAGNPQLPRTFVRDRLVTVGPRDWTSGFFPGALWLIYEQTHDPALRAAAESFTERLKEIQDFTGHHDVGFMLGCSYGEGWRIAHPPAYREVLIRGARSLSTRFDPHVGAIRSWSFGEWQYPVIIDNMMNLGLLWFAYRETGEPAFAKIVVSHADKTLENHFRPDGSSFHLVNYNASTGAVLGRQTVQGFADSSAWARGQAWALSGYATVARLTGDRRYLVQARKVADFIRSHPRLPADGVPYWDFDASDIPNAPRDTAAAAVMALGLLDLARQLPAADADPYRRLAEKQLRSLSGRAYRAELNANGGFLLMHATGHLPAKSEIDVPLNYADYYFLKALASLLGGEPAPLGIP